MFCPVCGGEKLDHLPQNSPVADFTCCGCGSEFELKSKESRRGCFGRTIADGAYGTMVERITSKNNPHLFVMLYADWKVDWLQLIPNFLFVPDIIEKRKPLSATARKAGWIGCNIAVGNIPSSGKINIIQNGRQTARSLVLSQYRNVLGLATNRVEQRGWLFDVLKCVEEIPTDDFSIDDVYFFSKTLEQKYPGNRFVKPKIRQQLQRLRDRGFISFLGHGRYSKTDRVLAAV